MDELSTWQVMAEDVSAGRLFLERGVANRCAGHCSVLVERLVELRVQARRLGRVEGFGTFPSGIALAEKFSKKAVGGDYSMVQALTDHIAEVEAMRDVFLRIESRYVATDENGAQALAAIDPEVGG